MADALDTTRVNLLVRRVLTNAGTAINLPVANGATSAACVFVRSEPDTAYGVALAPSWVTAWGVTSKTTGGVTVTFGTPAPTGATLDYAIYR